MAGPDGMGSASAQGSSGCLCIAFFFALFAAFSPYWIWNAAYLYTFGIYRATVTTASGSYIFSALTGSVPCGWWYSCYITSQWNSFDAFNNTLCTGDYYTQVGQYGFCSKQGDFTDEFLAETGVRTVPSQISAMQGLTIATTVCLFFATVIACASGADGSSKQAMVAAILSFLAMVMSCAAFSVAVSYDYYQLFSASNGGHVLPYLVYGGTQNCGSSGYCITLSPSMAMYWGPAFGGMVFVFCVTFFTTIFLCGAVKAMRDEEKESKAYRDFDQGFGGPQTGDGYQEPTLA